MFNHNHPISIGLVYLEIATTNRWEVIDSNSLKLINMINQSKMGNNSQIVLITFFSSRFYSFRWFLAPSNFKEIKG